MGGFLVDSSNSLCGFFTGSTAIGSSLGAVFSKDSFNFNKINNAML